MSSECFTNILCPQCNQVKPRLISAVNRAFKLDVPLYCSRKCFAASRKLDRSKETKKLLKKAYDARYRSENLARIKARKAAYFQRTYDPIQAAVDRKKRMPQHLEYCRQPEYKTYKKSYDRKHRAQKQFGPFGECDIVLQDLTNEIESRASKYEIRLANGTLNKVGQRRREYAQVQFEKAVLRTRPRSR